MYSSVRRAIVLMLLTIVSASGSDAVATAVPPVAQGYVQFMAIDADGNRYITGSFDGNVDFNPNTGEDSKTSSGTDAFITRYNADGSYAWTKKFGGNGTDAAYAITVSGNTVFVAGDFMNTASLEGGTGITSTGNYDGFILALNATDGSEIWKQKFGGTGEDHPRAIAVANGKVFITGYFGSNDAGIGGTGSLAINGGLNVFIAAVNATNGSELWKQRLGGSSYNNGLGIAASSTDVYVTGEFSLTADYTGGGIGTVTSSGGANAFILDLNPADGTGKWMKQFGGNPGNDVGRGVALDGNTLYVTGNFEAGSAGLGGSGTLTNSGNSNAFIVAMNATDGSEIWKQKFGGSDWDKGFAITASGSSVFVAGELPSSNAHVGSNVSTIGTSGNVDVFVLALSSVDGSEVWKHKFGGSNDDHAASIAVYGSTVWTAGYFASSNAGIGGTGTISAVGFNGFLLPLDTTTGKAIQSIAFDPLYVRILGDPDTAPGAITSSGLPVTYASSDPSVATIVSGKMHFVGAGSTLITASQAGNADYVAASDVGRMLNVVSGNLISQTISFGALQNKTFGDAPFTVSATGGASGNAVTFSVFGSATINGSVVTITGAGLVTVRASQAGTANYFAAGDVDQSFIVAKATPALSWENPAAIVSGTLLSSAQLNASSNVQGTFAYIPASGTLLRRGSSQSLSVQFTPGDSANYNSAISTVAIDVLNAVPVISSSPTASPNPATTGAAVVFSSAATDADTDTLTYTWDFGDGTTASGEVALHTYSVPGTYSAVLNVNDAHGGKTLSTFALTVASPSRPPGSADTDGDGFSDSIEIASGSSAVNAADTPTGSAAVLLPMADTTLSIKLNFAKASNDSIQLGGTLLIGESVSINQAKLAADIGGVAKLFVLSSAGTAKVGSDSAGIKSKGTGTRSGKFSIKLSKGNFASILSAVGLTNATLRKEVEFPVSVLFAGYMYQTTVTLDYSAKQGKSGAAKNKR